MSAATVTLGEALDHYAQLRPDEVVLLCAREDGSVDQVSRAELRHQSDAFARALVDAGVEPGVLVPIVLPTGTDFLLAAVSVYKAGGTPMPVSHKLPEAERDALLALGEPVVVISDRALSVNTLDPRDFHGCADAAPIDPVRISNPIKALASGGSTGRPKLIVTPGALQQPLGEIAVAQMLRFRDGDLKYSPGPLYHNGPFWFSINMLFTGGRVLLNERFNASRALSLIETYHPEVLNLVPTMMQRMLRDPAWQTCDLSSVRVVWHLAAPCPPWAKEGFIDRLGGETVLELWAATESTGLTVLDGNEWLDHRGSVGKPLGTEILILDEARQPVATGEVGEIFTRFAGAPAQYSYRGANALETVEGGYASVGDLGWLDQDGYLYLADRRTDLIISGGANVFPAEVEAVISQHPAVADVAVIGLSDKDLGRRVHAVIELRPDVEPPHVEDILTLCNTQLVRYKVPRGIEFVDALPRNEAGKIRRLSLRESRDQLAS